MQPREKILKVLDDFGISGKKAAEAMKIKSSTFRKNKAEGATTHKFNEKNYQDLIEFIKTEAKKL